MNNREKIEKAEKLIYQMQNLKGIPGLIKELNKLKYQDCPIADEYISKLFFSKNFSANIIADDHIENCLICLLISIAILAKEENWTFDSFRSYYLINLANFAQKK